MLTEEDRKTLEGIAKPHAFDARMEMLANYHRYVLEEATKDRVLLKHGRYTWCDISVVRDRIHVDLKDYGVCRFKFWSDDAIHAVRFLAGSDVDYLAEKWTLGRNLAEPTEWIKSAAAHDVLEFLEDQADENEEDDSLYLRADWSSVVYALEFEALGGGVLARHLDIDLATLDFEGAALRPFQCALSAIEWELPSAGLGMRYTDTFLHCLHAAREAKRQLARVI